ncbi:MAG: hypothetical protein RL228_874 [Actinomycetota bacterium]|jgi:hypothetical protein
MLDTFLLNLTFSKLSSGKVGAIADAGLGYALRVVIPTLYWQTIEVSSRLSQVHFQGVINVS